MRNLTRTAILAGAALAVIRLGLFWYGVTLYTGYSDDRQSIGYAVLILNSLIELGIAILLTGRHPAPLALAAVLIVPTSLALAWGFVSLWSTLRRT